ncbi:MAG TPA: DUF3224 domain-containing protein [Terriglobales bacterium]|jgi:hypothetical protein|nr:DUF3224 domain-containing protein [Terriglobales bacterium]
MNTGFRLPAWFATALCLCFSSALSARAQNSTTAPGNPAKETVVSSHATGTFDVKVTPQPPEDKSDPSLARLTLDKQFHGDLEGSSKGQMLAASSSVKGSAGYVAIERVTGTLLGRKGSFTLQHSGTMTRGTPHLVVSVVPDSGSDELAGLAGTMTIKIESGKHYYDFEYRLAETH